MKNIKTYKNKDLEDMACSCNFHLAPVIVDVDNLIIFCSICGHSESFPEYALNFPESEIKNYYAEPLKEYVGKDWVERLGKGLTETFKSSFWKTVRS